MSPKALVQIGTTACVLLGMTKIMLANDTTWTVDAERFRCVVSNLELYESQKSDPVVIYLDACPEADPVKASGAIARNQGVPSIKRGPIDRNQITPIVVFTKAELKCLQPHLQNQQSNLLRIPKRPC